MYRAISSFLQNRVIQIKLGRMLSSPTILKKGIPQGSCLSALLYNTHMAGIQRVSMAGVANLDYIDDRLKYTVSDDIIAAVQIMQKSLTSDVEWMKQRNLLLAESKCKALVITSKTNQHEMKPSRKVEVNGKPLEWSDEICYLGITLDRRFSGEKQTDMTVATCEKKINVLKRLTAPDWGLGRDQLLMIYRGLIRTRIDYAAPVFNHIKQSVKAKLVSIEYKALRVVTGAIIGTPLTSMQVLIGEKPLELRWNQLTALCYAKRKALGLNQMYQRHGAAANNPMRMAVVSDMEARMKLLRGVVISEHTLDPKVPPWKISALDVVTEVQDITGKKNTDEKLMKQLFLRSLEAYTNHLKIFTDGSKDPADDSVGAAIYIQNSKRTITARVANGASVVSAEIAAIAMALRASIKISPANVAIFSDSKAALMQIKNSHGAIADSHYTREVKELNDILGKKKIAVKYQWVPAHIGIESNEEADKAANRARLLPHPRDSKLSYSEVKSIIKQRTLNEFQQRWENATKGREFHMIHPNVQMKTRQKSPNEDQAKENTKD
jgi:ribonuclease HI